MSQEIQEKHAYFMLFTQEHGTACWFTKPELAVIFLVTISEAATNAFFAEEECAWSVE